MILKKNTLTAAILSAMIGVAGCSSSDDTPTSTTTAANVTGKITGFGSVYVDGVEFETNGTEIYIDGDLASEDELKVGMLVNLIGSDDGKNGNAISISFDDEVEGVVTKNDADGFEVMGLKITADGTTHFDGVTDTNNDGADLSDIPAGAKVEVSGYPDGNGGVHATYIELENDNYVDGDEIEVKGIIGNLDPTAETFTIGTMTVDFSGVTTYSDGLTQASDLANGLYVEVKSNTAPAANVLAATEIELEDGGEYGVSGDDGDEMEVEGMISSIETDPNDANVIISITVNGQTFDIPAGLVVPEIAVGDVVDLDLEMVGGVAVITEIEDESHDDDHPGKIEVEAIVDATDTTDGSSSITLGGLTIAVDPAKVVMLDYSATANQIINLGDIDVGDRVEVEAIPNADGPGYIAISIEREASIDDITNLNPSLDQYVELEGPVTVIDSVAGTFSVADVVIDLSSVDINEGKNTLGDIADGYKISVKLVDDGNGTLVVTKVEVDVPEVE